MTKVGRNDILRLERVEGPAIDPIAIAATGTTVVGRGRECAVCLPDAAVSRRHASVARHDGRWRVTDLGSRHGTFVNTIRIDPNEPASLEHRDFFGIGPWAFCVELPESAPDDPEGSEAPTPTTARSDEHATRPTIFLRLGASDTSARELSWRQFADRYRPVIVGFARNAGASPGDAEDILQDVMLGFFRVSDAFEYDPARGRFRGYLKRAVYNAIRARHRRNRPDADANLDRIGADDGAAEAQWSWHWMRAVLERALTEVRPQFESRTWEAFELYGLRSVPADEVAERLGMSNESVRHAKSRVARAVRKVVERIRGEEG